MPTEKPEEAQAVEAVTSWLRELRAVIPRFAVGGFTRSVLRPAVFGGDYWSDIRGIWISEFVSVLIVDVTFEGENFKKFIDLLSLEISNRYLAVNSKQDEPGISWTEVSATYNKG